MRRRSDVPERFMNGDNRPARFVEIYKGDRMTIVSKSAIKY